jgi:pimeloyl-ACP methyl ester carboxylesterase
MNRILYLHGFASGPSSGKARYFAQKFRDRGVDLEILDLAAGDFEHLTITGQLGVIERAAAGSPVSLIGSSMGGYLAALYAQRHPEVERLVLMAPAFAFARRWPESLGADRVAEWERTGAMEVYHYGDDRQRPLHFGLLEDARRYADFPDFPQPALIFHGEHDDVVPAQYSIDFAATHPNVRLEVLDSGHELHNVLDYMAPRVLEFLNQP